MAIQPLDLQAIFSQVDKVGRTQANIREGQQMQDALHQADTQRKLEQNVKSVNQAQNMGQETMAIKDENREESGAYDAPEANEKEKEEEQEVQRPEIIKDPALGKNLDIEG
ncbi:MAG: hypothetical protein FWG77_01565 [Treponema sp.]|nr:hypothetical protein [Treponema sp.]